MSKRLGIVESQHGSASVPNPGKKAQFPGHSSRTFSEGEEGDTEKKHQKKETFKTATTHQTPVALEGPVVPTLIDRGCPFESSTWRQAPSLSVPGGHDSAAWPEERERERDV